MSQIQVLYFQWVRNVWFRFGVGIGLQKYPLLAHHVCADMDGMGRYDAGLGEVCMADLIGYQTSAKCPLPDYQRPLFAPLAMSQKGQFRTHALHKSSESCSFLPLEHSPAKACLAREQRARSRYRVNKELIAFDSKVTPLFGAVPGLIPGDID